MSLSELTFNSGNIDEPLDPACLDNYLTALSDWQVSGVAIASLVKDFRFGNFVEAMAFAGEITELAEHYNHHPELTITYGNVRVNWWTHTASGITGNDVFMANQCDLKFQQ